MVLGSRTATILPRLTFSTFLFASHSSAHCSKGRAAACLCLSSCFSVLGSLPSLSRSLGLAHAPSFLRAICSIPSFGIAKVAVNVCSPDTNRYQQKCQQIGRLGSDENKL